VDLNRNFGDAHRLLHGEPPGDERYPGPRGFSEPESRILKSLLGEVKPDLYVSVHSGAYLLATPMGYTKGKVLANQADLLEVLGPISSKYCGGDCPYGSLSAVINYDSAGCDIDYVAEQTGTPWVFTWEIYTGEDFRERYVKEARAQRGRGSHSNSTDEAPPSHVLAQTGLSKVARTTKSLHQEPPRGLGFRLRGGSGIDQLATRAAARAARFAKIGAADLAARFRHAVKPEDEQDAATCMRQFNPRTAKETADVLTRWTGAYLELCEQVAARQRGKQH